jgi:glutaredoxin-related protein
VPISYALKAAIAEGNLALVKTHLPPPKIGRVIGIELLRIAANAGKLDIVNYFLDSPNVRNNLSDCEVFNEWNNAPNILCAAIVRGNIELLNRLLEFSELRAMLRARPELALRYVILPVYSTNKMALAFLKRLLEFSEVRKCIVDQDLPTIKKILDNQTFSVENAEYLALAEDQKTQYLDLLKTAFDTLNKKMAGKHLSDSFLKNVKAFISQASTDIKTFLDTHPKDDDLNLRSKIQAKTLEIAEQYFVKTPQWLSILADILLIVLFPVALCVGAYNKYHSGEFGLCFFGRTQPHKELRTILTEENFEDQPPMPAAPHG